MLLGRAFSLIETLVAGAIFAVGMAAILTCVSTYMGAVEHDRKLSQAWRVLQGQATHLRSLPESAAEWTSSTEVSVNASGGAGDDFTVERKVANYFNGKSLTLTAHWMERQSPKQAVLVLHR